MFRASHLVAKINRDESSAPEWMLLFKAGWGQLGDGTKFLVDQTAFDLLKAFIASQGNEIHFDYEHASLDKTAAPAAGWIKELVWEEGIGIRARVEWTAKAAEFIANKEYKYFSPVFYVRKSDSRISGLDSVALTNRPLTSNLTPILARLEAGLEKETNKEEKRMDRKELIKALGLENDATDALILEALAKLGIKLPAAKTETKEVIPEKITAALDLKKDDDISTIVASILALKQTDKTGVSREDFKKLQAKLAEKEATDAVNAAMKAGKIAPVQKEWATEYAKDDLKGFQTFIAKAPVVVPFDKLPGKTEDKTAGTMTETDLQIAKMMGVSEDDIKKYGGNR